MNFELTASMMCANYGNLEKEVRDLEEAGIDSFHIDIMDGRYVPNYAMGLHDLQYIASVTTKPLDVHLMVEHPNNHINLFLRNLRKGDTMNIALLLSGGTGTRMGADIPKQYLQVDGKPIITYCLEVLFSSSCIEAVWIVAEMQWRDFITEHIRNLDKEQKFRGFSNPGETRQLSILNGLENIWRYMEGNDCVAENDCVAKNDYVLIHDAARPNLSGRLIKESFEAVSGHDGVLPVLPMKDTVYRSKDGRRIDELLNRSEIFAGQAPETFILGKYLEANRRLLPNEIKCINGSTEPAILAGMDVVTIPGNENNFKITTQTDLERFRNKASNPISWDDTV